MIGFGGALALEWRHLRGDRSLWVLLGLYALLMVAAAGNGRSLVTARSADAQRVVAEAAFTADGLQRQADRWTGRGKPPVAVQPGPVAFSAMPAWAVKPPAPLQALALGQSDLLPDRYAVTARPAHTFFARGELASPAALAIGVLDVAFLVVFGLPIVVLAIAFSVGSREREAGTLAIAAAQGIAPEAFITAKWAARGVATVATLLLALALAAGLGWGAGVGPGMDVAGGSADLAAWLALAVGYAGFWFALCLYVNAGRGSSDRNGVALMGSWVAFVVVVPALAALAVTTVFPPPSRVELTTVLREASEAADRAAAAARDRYFFDHPELGGREIDPDEFYRAVAATEAEITRAVQPALAEFDTQAVRQQQLVDRLQYLSPAMIVQQGVFAASGTDSARYADFRAQVAAFHATWREYFVARLERGDRLTSRDYAGRPQFRYVPPPALERWQRLAAPLLVLYGVDSLIVWLAWRRLRRQPVV